MIIRLALMVSLISGVCLAQTGFDPDQIQLMRETAAEICEQVEQQSGSATVVELQGEIRAEVQGLVRQLFDVGAAGVGGIQQNRFEGITREALATALSEEAACRQDMFTLMFNGMMDLLRQQEARAGQSKKIGGRINLGDLDLKRVGPAVPGAVGEYFVLLSVDHETRKSAVLHIDGTEAEAQGTLRTAPVYYSDDEAYDLAWDARHGVLVLRSTVVENGARYLVVDSVRNGEVSAVFIEKILSEPNAGVLGVLGDTYAISYSPGAGARLFLADRMFDTYKELTFDLDIVNGIAEMADGRILVAGADYEGRGRENGMVPGYVHRRVPGPGHWSGTFHRESQVDIPFEDKYGWLTHVFPSPDGVYMLAVGYVHDLDAPEHVLPAMVIAGINGRGDLIFEMSEPGYFTQAEAKRMPVSVFWDDEANAILYVQGETGAQRYLIDLQQRRYEHQQIARHATAPADGCVCVPGAQATLESALMLQVCPEPEGLALDAFLLLRG